MQLAHERVGSGRPIVLVHGITERGEAWRPLVAPLARDHTVLIVDLRGHGSSPRGDSYDPLTLAADVHETVLAADLGEDAPLMIGHSLGGVVVSAYAAMFRTRGVINIDQPLHLSVFKDVLGQMEPMLRGSPDSFAAALDTLLSPMMAPLDATETARIVGLRRADQDVVLGVWSTVLEATPKQLDAQVARLAVGLAVPYLSLHGADPGPDYPAWLAGLVPSAIVEVWPDHGHYPHLVDQARFLDRVHTFDATL